LRQPPPTQIVAIGFVRQIGTGSSLAYIRPLRGGYATVVQDTPARLCYSLYANFYLRRKAHVGAFDRRDSHCADPCELNIIFFGIVPSSPSG
jgi:hypothetical protein